MGKSQTHSPYSKYSDTKMSAKFLVGSLALVFLLTTTGLTCASDQVDPLQPFDNVMSKLTMLSHRIINLVPVADGSSSRAKPSCAVDCGVANAESKIIGEEETAPNEFPWQATLLVVASNNETNTCGGSLIADRWILTSASCLKMPSGQKLAMVYVYLGAHNISAPTEVNRKEYWSNQTFIHPNWNATTEAGDIALVNLSTVVECTKYIRPICLPSASEPDHVNQNVTVTGVGLQIDDDNTTSLVLYKMNVTVAPTGDCNAAYNNGMTNEMICARGSDSGICQVDIGNPMMFRQANGTYKQIGIVSPAPKSNDFCQIGGPSRYTRLSSYSDWVKEITSSATSQTSTAFLLLLVSFVSFAVAF